MKRDLKGVRKLARRYLGEFRQRGWLNNPNRWDQETERRPAQLKCDYCQMEGAGTGVRVGEGGLVPDHVDLTVHCPDTGFFSGRNGVTEDSEQKHDMICLTFKSIVLTAVFEEFKQGAMLGGNFINLGKR